MTSWRRSPWTAVAIGAVALLVNWPMLSSMFEADDPQGPAGVEDAIALLDLTTGNDATEDTGSQEGFRPVARDEVVADPFLHPADDADQDAGTREAAVRMILIKSSGGAAVIGDELVRVGEEFELGTLEEVRRDSVVIRSKSGTVRVLFLGHSGGGAAPPSREAEINPPRQG